MCLSVSYMLVTCAQQVSSDASKLAEILYCPHIISITGDSSCGENRWQAAEDLFAGDCAPCGIMPLPHVLGAWASTARR